MQNLFGITWPIAAMIVVGIAFIYTFLWPRPQGEFIAINLFYLALDAFAGLVINLQSITKKLIKY